MFSIAIVGGGAAGLATAIFAAQRCPGASVAVLDGARSLGAKILVSGGGRCNVTNVEVGERDFNGGRPASIRRVLRSLTAQDTVRWFTQMGVPLHEEARGKLFPDSNRARTVLDALVGEARARGVRILAGQRVEGLERAAEGFTIVTSGGVTEARLAVLATGGCRCRPPGATAPGCGWRKPSGTRS